MKQSPEQCCVRIFPALACCFFSLLLLMACGGGGGGGGGSIAPSPTSITLTRIASGFAEPVQISNAGDGSGRLFVVERGGVVRILSNGIVLPTPFLDIRALVQSAGGEQGLLGIAFPPGFTGKRYFYVNYTSLAGVGDTVVARYPLTANPDAADAVAGISLLNVTQPFANHNGGQLAFGPNGFLYIALGDGGSGGDPLGSGQSLTTLLGKILRIDVESGIVPYAIPAGNPFGNEIWAYGLRNPWRFSFDRGTGDLYVADVGQNLIEEVNFQSSASSGGENYGWNIMEGSVCFNNTNCNQVGLTLPVAEYSHDGVTCSITGGFVYRGAQYPALQGTYIYGDFCSGRLWGLKRVGTGWENRLLLDSTLSISSFGEDEAGNLYVADYAAGDIYKIDVP